jgi:hypothetical protein
MVREKQKPKIRPQEGFGFGLNPPKTWIAGAQRRQSQGLRMVREKQKPKIPMKT